MQIIFYLTCRSFPETSPLVEDANKVVTDHDACTSIGDEVLQQGGNAVDAAVAATVCMAVVQPHVTGLVKIFAYYVGGAVVIVLTLQ